MNLAIIVLAGGKGTRIKPVLGNTPKILAPIAGKSFLEWFLEWIKGWKLDINPDIFLSTCIGHDEIENFCKSKNLNLKCVREDRPLGTFGAIANVASNFAYCHYLVLNGDTIFEADLKLVYENFKKDELKRPMIILKESKNNERYGGYKLIKNGWIYTKNRTPFISMGAFFISAKELKKRWVRRTNIPFDSIAINKLIKSEIMIDKDCFGEEPIRATKLKSGISFLDIGIPSSYNISQTYIPSFFKNLINEK